MNRKRTREIIFIWRLTENLPRHPHLLAPITRTHRREVCAEPRLDKV